MTGTSNSKEMAIIQEMRDSVRLILIHHVININLVEAPTSLIIRIMGTIIDGGTMEVTTNRTTATNSIIRTPIINRYSRHLVGMR